jgi:hypothetical protein
MAGNVLIPLFANGALNAQSERARIRMNKDK